MTLTKHNLKIMNTTEQKQNPADKEYSILVIKNEPINVEELQAREAEYLETIRAEMVKCKPDPRKSKKMRFKVRQNSNKHEPYWCVETNIINAWLEEMPDCRKKDFFKQVRAGKVSFRNLDSRTRGLNLTLEEIMFYCQHIKVKKWDKELVGAYGTMNFTYHRKIKESGVTEIYGKIQQPKYDFNGEFEHDLRELVRRMVDIIPIHYSFEAAYWNFRYELMSKVYDMNINPKALLAFMIVGNHDMLSQYELRCIAKKVRECRQMVTRSNIIKLLDVANNVNKGYKRFLEEPLFAKNLLLDNALWSCRNVMHNLFRLRAEPDRITSHEIVQLTLRNAKEIHVDTALHRFVEKAAEEVKQKIKAIPTKIENTYEEVMDRFSVDIVELAQKAGSAAVEPLQNILDSMRQFLEPILDMFKGMVGKIQDLYNSFCSIIGVYKRNIAQIDVKDVVYLLVAFILYKKCNVPLIRASIVSLVCFKYGLIGKIWNAMKYCKEQFWDKDDEIPCVEDTCDLTSILKFVGMDTITLISTIIGAIIFIVTGYAATQTDRGAISKIIADALRNWHFATAGIVALTKMAEILPNIVTKIMDYLKEQFTSAGQKAKANKLDDQAKILKLKGDALKFLTTITQLATDKGVQNIKVSPRMQQKIVDLEPVAIHLQIALASGSFKDCEVNFKTMLTQSFRDYKMLRNVVYRVCRYGGFRKTPFHVQLFGEPGQGKSTMIQALSQAIRDRKYPDLSLQSVIWARADSDYFDNYANQPIAIMDDIWKINDAKLTTEILTLISNVPLPLPMAHLEDKGTFFTSEWVLSTTNIAYPYVKDVMCNEAVQRRRHMLVEVICDPKVYDLKTKKFCGKLFKQHYPQASDYDMRHTLPHLTFNICKPVQGEDGNYMRGQLFGPNDDIPAGLMQPLAGISYTELLKQIWSREDCIRKEEAMMRDTVPRVDEHSMDVTMAYVEELAERYGAGIGRLYHELDIGDFVVEETEPVSVIEEEDIQNSQEELIVTFEAHVASMCELNDDTVTDTMDEEALQREAARRARILRNAGRQDPALRAQAPTDDNEHNFMRHVHIMDDVASVDILPEVQMRTNRGVVLPIISWLHPGSATKCWLSKQQRDSPLWANRNYSIVRTINYGFLRNIVRDLDAHGNIIYRYRFDRDDFNIEDVKTAYEITMQPYYDNYWPLVATTNEGFVRAYESFASLSRDQQEDLLNTNYTWMVKMQSFKETLLVSAERREWISELKHSLLRSTVYYINKIFEHFGMIFCVGYFILVVYIWTQFIGSLFHEEIDPLEEERAKFIRDFRNGQIMDETSRVYFKGARNPLTNPTSRVFFKHNQKPTPFVTTTSQDLQIDSSKVSQISDCISRNMLLVLTSSGVANAIGIDGNCILMNYHTIIADLQKKGTFKLEYLPTRNSDDIWSVYIDTQKDVYHIPNTDAVIICNRHIPAFRKIKHHFVTEHDLVSRDVPSHIWHQYISTVNGTVTVVSNKCTDFKENFVCQSRALGTMHHRKVLFYGGDPPVGSSGGAVYGPTYKIARSIYGIQSSKGSMGGVVALVTQEDIQLAFDHFKNVHIVQEGPTVVDTLSTSPTGLLIKEHIKVIGVVPEEKVLGLVGKTALLPSLISSEFSSERIPAILSAWDARVPDGDHPLRHSINKYGRDVMKPLDPQILQLAKKAVAGYLICKKDTKLRVLTTEEAIRGLREPGYAPMNLTSSPGIPWVWSKDSGEVGKKSWIQYSIDGNLQKLDASVEQAVDEVEASMKKRIVPPHQWYEFPKDELRPEAKALGPPIKTRSISVMDMAFTIVARKYTLGFDAMCHRLSDGVFPMCPGINPESQDWTRMFHSLKGVSKVGTDLDVGNWDGHFPPELYYAAVDVVCDVYDEDLENEEQKREFRNVMETFAAENMYGHIQFLDIVVQTLRGVCSGSPWTTMNNTLGHFILTVYIYFKINTERGCLHKTTMAWFNREVGVRLYGDDVIWAISELSEITPERISQVYEHHGWPVTGAIKGQGLEWKSIEDLQFLKRNFKPDEILGTSLIHGAIEESVITDLCFWIKRQENLLTQQYVNINEAQTFAFAHGKEFYNHLLTRILKACRKNKIVPHLLSYEEMRSTMWSRVFPEKEKSYSMPGIKTLGNPFQGLADENVRSKHDLM